MHYKGLFRAADSFEHNYYAYDDAWKETSNLNYKELHNFSNDQVKERVIGFLNKWKCRIQYSDVLATRIKDTYRDLIPFLEALEGLSVEDLNLDKEVTAGNRKTNVRFALFTIFSDFSRIGDRFGDVAASKLLHLINSRLFVMWDNNIRQAYEIPKDANGYVRFLTLMRKEAAEAIETYVKDNKCDMAEATRRLNSYKEGKTLAKLLDEYNYMKFVRGLEFGIEEKTDRF